MSVTGSDVFQCHLCNLVLSGNNQKNVEYIITSCQDLAKNLQKYTLVTFTFSHFTILIFFFLL